jgi:glycosyltransferase involved in cell wall biosynthesis
MTNSVDKPFVSVLMTSYNRQQYIGDAIQSVLNSSYSNFELIIVDDCSTDSTVEIARSFEENDKRIKVYVNENNLGDYPNRNRAASYATGKYIKYVDSDDCLYPSGLEVMVAALELYPQAAIAFSSLRLYDSKPYPLFFSGAEALRKHFFEGGLLHAGPSTTIIRLDAFKTIGGFSGKRYVSDYEAWLNICLSFSVVVLQPGLVWVRTHEGQEFGEGALRYYSLNYNLHKAFIEKAENPFSPEERKRILLNYKILLSRRVYQRLIKKYGIKKSLRTIKESGEYPSLLFYAFLPMRK